MDNEIYFEVNRIVNLITSTPDSELKKVLDQIEINDRIFNILLSRYYAYLVNIGSIFVGALEKNIDNMEYKRKYYFNDHTIFKRIIEVYNSWTILPSNIINMMMDLGKDKYMAKLDPNYKFMGYDPKYISNNLDILTISFSKIKTRKINELEWGIIISSAYVYEIFTNSLSLDYDGLDLNQIIEMLLKDSELFDKIINSYKQYRLIKGEKLVLDESVMSSHYSTLLKLNPSIIIELIEKTFYKQGLVCEKKLKG